MIIKLLIINLLNSRHFICDGISRIGIMMKHRKQLERRTFLQDRFDILIKKQKDGRATFADLTELDFIVNHSSMIRNKVLEEMQKNDNSSDDEIIEELPLEFIKTSTNFFDKIKLVLGRLFTLKFSIKRCSFYLKNAYFTT